MSTKLFLRTLAGFVFIAFSISLPSGSFAQEGKWTTKADMPTARWALSTSVVDGKIYAISGRIQFTGAWTASAEEYDPATDTWTKKADIPTARSWLSTSVVDGKIYAIDGWSKTNASPVEEYDPATDTWTKKTDMPIQRWELATSAVDGKIYVIGGGNWGAVEEYDPAMDTWTRKADMPTPRGRLSASAVNGKIYAIGGSNWDNATNQEIILSAVEEYDPATDTWTKKADLPMPTHEHAASVVHGKIYVMGGEGALTQTPGAAQTILSTIMKYDPATDTWTKEGDMPVPRTAMSASVVDGRIYVIGGREVGVRGISTVEVYKPEPWGFASDPNPANGTLHLTTWVILDWTAGDFAVSHDVYFSENSEDVNSETAEAFRGNQAEPFFVAGFPGFPYPEGLMRGTTYYWRIDEINDLNSESPWIGDVWSFTIPSENAYHPDPPDGTESVDLNVELSWTAGLDAVLHTVYFGDSFADVDNATGGTPQAASTYAPGPLKPARTYCWRVDESTGGRTGETHKGDVWSFTTQGAVGNPNPANGADVNAKTKERQNAHVGDKAGRSQRDRGTAAQARGQGMTSPGFPTSETSGVCADLLNTGPEYQT